MTLVEFYSRMNWWATSSCFLACPRLSGSFQKKPVSWREKKIKEMSNHNWHINIVSEKLNFSMLLILDRVLCHFCFKPKKVTNDVLSIDNSRKSQILISSIILLKTALDALPLLSKVHQIAFHIILFSLILNWFEIIIVFFHPRFLRMQGVFFLEMFTSPSVRTKNMLWYEKGTFLGNCRRICLPLFPDRTYTCVVTSRSHFFFCIFVSLALA